MANILGLDAVLFRGEAGTQATTEVVNVRDLNLNLESSETETTTRKSKGWKAFMATQKSATLEFDVLYDTEDEDYNAFARAYLGNKAISFFVTDGSGNGLDADFSITGFKIKQALEEAITVSITAKPTASQRAPEWIDSASGSSE